MCASMAVMTTDQLADHLRDLRTAISTLRSQSLDLESATVVLRQDRRPDSVLSTTMCISELVLARRHLEDAYNRYTIAEAGLRGTNPFEVATA